MLAARRGHWSRQNSSASLTTPLPCRPMHSSDARAPERVQPKARILHSIWDAFCNAERHKTPPKECITLVCLRLRRSDSIPGGRAVPDILEHDREVDDDR